MVDGGPGWVRRELSGSNREVGTMADRVWAGRISAWKEAGLSFEQADLVARTLDRGEYGMGVYRSQKMADYVQKLVADLYFDDSEEAQAALARILNDEENAPVGPTTQATPLFEVIGVIENTEKL